TGGAVRVPVVELTVEDDVGTAVGDGRQIEVEIDLAVNGQAAIREDGRIGVQVELNIGAEGDTEGRHNGPLPRDAVAFEAENGAACVGQARLERHGAADAGTVENADFRFAARTRASQGPVPLGNDDAFVDRDHVRRVEVASEGGIIVSQVGGAAA